MQSLWISPENPREYSPVFLPSLSLFLSRVTPMISSGREERKTGENGIPAKKKKVEGEKQKPSYVCAQGISVGKREERKWERNDWTRKGEEREATSAGINCYIVDFSICFLNLQLQLISFFHVNFDKLFRKLLFIPTLSLWVCTS